MCWFLTVGKDKSKLHRLSLAFKAFLSRPALDGLRDLLHSCLHLA